MAIVEAVTVTLYRVANRPKGWRKGKPRRQKALAYRDAAWAKLRFRCRCVVPDDPLTPRTLCRYHDREFRADPGGSEDPPTFWPPASWRLPRWTEPGYWDYGRAVAYRLARFYAHIDARGSAGGGTTP